MILVGVGSIDGLGCGAGVGDGDEAGVTISGVSVEIGIEVGVGDVSAGVGDGVDWMPVEAMDDTKTRAKASLGKIFPVKKFTRLSTELF